MTTPASVFELFKPGVGPSSSHTMGPMSAGLRFVRGLHADGALALVERVEVELLGSLASTGRGHRTDDAVVLGLAGFDPATIDANSIPAVLSAVAADRRIALNGRHAVPFDPADIHWTRQAHPRHPNAVRFTAVGAGQRVIDRRLFFSTGGGFIATEAELDAPPPAGRPAPHPFRSGAELLAMADAAGLSIPELARANERARGLSDAEIDARLDALWARMEACVKRGLSQDGELPGGLRVPRRARRIHEMLRAHPERLIADPLSAMDFVNVWALAVNEENAAGGAVVTAPTNGAAGIIPAVITYFRTFRGGAAGAAAGTRDFLLAAGAVGALYKRNASISGAEVGCQGEVGVACSMAAAGLTAALGGSNAQVENAAEIGMEHNLGLTCDPVGGLVQIPCIERNAMGAIKAIDASRLALLGDGSHHVSLDKVIATMRATGADMHAKYKETSEGGLAVAFVAC